MITLHELDTAIAKYQGLADPKPTDAIKLAACYIIRNEMYGQQDKAQAIPAYSYAAPPEITEKPLRDSGQDTVGEYGDSDFLQAVKGKNPADVWAVMDELMDTLHVVNERVYNGVMRKIDA